MLTFSQVNVHNGPANSQPDPQGAKAYVRDTVNQMLKLIARSLEWWCLTKREQTIIDAMIGQRHQISNCFASNLSLRLKLARHLIDQLDHMSQANPQRRFMLVTLISDRWLSYDRDVYIWLGGMQQAIRKVMDIGGFDGWFGMIEIQSLSEGERGLGRILLPHFHAIAWTDDPAFDSAKAETRMQSSKRLITVTGAKTAIIKHHSDTHAVNLGAYIMKAPSLAKYRVPDMHVPAGFRLEPTALAPVSAVRLLEILSAIYFDELMLSGGTGKPIRVALKRHMIEGATRINGLVDIEQSARFLQNTRKRTRRDHNYYPVAIVRDPVQLPADCPISLACPRLQERVSKRKDLNSVDR